MSSIPSDITCDGKVFPRHNLRDMRPLFVQDTISMASEECLFSSTILRRRCDHSMVGPSPATHSYTSITMLRVNNSQQELLSCRFFDHVSSNIYIRIRCCVTTAVLPPCPFSSTCVNPKSHTTRRRGRLRVAISTAPDLSGSDRVDMLTRPVAAA